MSYSKSGILSLLRSDWLFKGSRGGGLFECHSYQRELSWRHSRRLLGCRDAAGGDGEADTAVADKRAKSREKESEEQPTPPGTIFNVGFLLSLCPMLGCVSPLVRDDSRRLKDIPNSWWI